MKLNQFSQNEVEVLGDSVDTEFSIDTESLGVLFKGFSDALYSDKFGSIVREVTSNCFDAHEEVGQKLDVQVRMVTPGFDEGKIVFEDFGPGLSPDRIKNIYSKYFASTKRNTNDQIGGFGIGAKSPLAYADSFNVVTRVDGVEYDYIIHKGEQVPMITLIGTKPTDSINGTQVIIPIANNADYSSFVSAVKDQLRYFDNISYKIPNEDISNEYKIFRGKHWIHTTNGTSSGDLEICIGKVGYPLDFKAAGFENFYYHERSANFALYFDVGEISVTMNRESIEYNSKTRKAIKEKVELFKKEAKEIQIKNNRTSDLQTWYSLTRENSRQVRVTDECILKSSYFFDKSEAVYEPLEHLGKVPNSPLYFITAHKSVGFSDKSAPRTIKESTLCSLLFDKSERYGSPSRYVKGVKIFRLRDRMNAMKDLYIQETYGKFVVVKLDQEYKDSLTNYFAHKAPTGQAKAYGEMYAKEMIKQVVKHTESYDDLVVPEDWIADYKASRKKGKTVRSIEVIPYKSLACDYDDNPAFSQKNAKVKDLLSIPKTIVYGSTNDRRKLMTLYQLLFNGAASNGIDRYVSYAKELRSYKFIMISEQRKKFFVGHKNTINVNDFLAHNYSAVSRIFNFHNLMDTPNLLADTNPMFTAVRDRQRHLPDYVFKEFISAFKFVYNPDNEYITLSNGKQASVTELQNYFIEFKNAHPLHGYIRYGAYEDGDEYQKSLKHYLNLINFNSKIKCYG